MLLLKRTRWQVAGRMNARNAPQNEPMRPTKGPNPGTETATQAMEHTIAVLISFMIMDLQHWQVENLLVGVVVQLQQTLAWYVAAHRALTQSDRTVSTTNR